MTTSEIENTIPTKLVENGPNIAKLSFLIVGTPRSGTTLVQRLASELPGVRVPPETHFFSAFLPAFVGRRSFPLVGRSLHDALAAFCALPTSNGLELDVAEVIHRLGGRCESPLQLFCAIVAHLAGEAKVYGEKTPDHLLWWRPLTKALPELKVVLVVRDPRGFVASFPQAWGEHCSPAYLASRWSADQRELLRHATRSVRVSSFFGTKTRWPRRTRPGLRLGDFCIAPSGSEDDGAHGETENLFLPWETWRHR